jgi:ABC-type transport system substrate-binding protein
LKLDFRVFAGAEPERTQLIMTDTWRRGGIEVQPIVQPTVQIRDWQTAATFPGIAAVGGGLGERMFTSAEIGTPANGWVGANRPGWSNAEYDRLYDQFVATLDKGGRTRPFAEMQRILTEQLPLFIPYFALQVNARAAALSGPEAEFGGVGTFSPRALVHWNIQDWELR